VWARRQVGLATCPTSYITAQSVAWLEEFFVRRQLGGIRVEELGAREAEAFLLLEDEVAQERKHVQANTRSDSERVSRG
jgi:adenosine deaminase